MTPTVLMYNLDSPKGMRLRQVCARLAFRTRDVSPDEYGRPLGALAGMPFPAPDAQKRTEAFADEMLVFVGFDSARLDELLSAMRGEGLRVALKAVLTPFNAAWDSVALHAAIREEHESMRK